MVVILKCPELKCKVEYTRNKRNLEVHLHREHGIGDIEMYRCDVKDCLEVVNEFYYPNQLDRHKFVFHNIGKPRKWKCCDICLTWFLDLNRHLNSCNKIKIKCTYPGCERHVTPTGLQRHLNEYHKEGTHFCTEYIGCTRIKPFASPDKLQRHVESVHLNIKKVSCLRCKSPFGRMTDFRVHLKDVHYEGVEWFECEYIGCPEVFTRESAMTVHENRPHSIAGLLRNKKEEEKIKKLLNKNDISFDRELKIDYTCVEKISDIWKKDYAKIDFVLHSNKYTILLEVDENQHKFGYGGVSCDMKRMNYILTSIRASGNNLPVLFLRYNPNNFKIDQQTQKVSDNLKQKELLDFIKNYSPDKSSNLEIKYLFYDTFSGSTIPDHCKSTEFHPELRKCIV
jgi:hypothetical protein